MKTVVRNVVILALCILALTTLAAAADQAGSHMITRQHNGAAESWIQTVDPAVPWTLNATAYPGHAGGRRALDETGQMLWETSHPTGLMDNVALSDDGSVVAIGVTLNEFQLQVYDGVSGSMVYSKAGVDGAGSVAVSGAGDVIAYANGHSLYLMSATDSVPIWTADMGTQALAVVGMSRQGDHIVACEAQTTQNQDSVRVWAFERASSTPLWTHAFPIAAVGGWYGVRFSSDGSRVVVTGNARIWVYDPTSGALVWTVEANNTQYPAEISGNGRVITTGSNGGTFRVFGWDTGANTYVMLFRYAFTGGSSNWATASAVSGDGSTVACGSLQFIGAGYAGYVAVFDTYGGGIPIYLSPTMYDLVADVAISDDGLTIAASSWGDFANPANPNILVMDKYNPTPFFSYAHPGSPNAIAINPTGTRVVAGGKAVHNRQFGNGGHAYLFSADLEGGTVTGTVTVNHSPVSAGVIVEAVGQHRMALTNDAGEYYIYNVPAGTHTISAHKLGFTSATVSDVVVTDGGTVADINFTLDTVGVAPANLSASQAQLTSVHLAWNPMTLRGHQQRDFDHRLAVGDEPLDPTRGPVASAKSGPKNATKSGWQNARHSALDDALDEPDSIRVWRGTTQGGPYVPVATIDGASVAYDDSFHVFPTINYYYVTTAIYPTGESVYSNEAQGRLDASYLVYNPTVPPLTTAVTFDGVLSPNEWADAIRIDASDVFGYDGPNPPHSVYLYMKYDDTTDKLLIACEDHNQATLDDGEGFGIYVDDDNNNAWSYNNVGSEGNYWAYYYSSGATLRYRSLSGGPYGSNYYVFPNPQIGFSAAAGYVTGEVAIPMGFHQPYEIALYGPNRTAGIGFFITNRQGGGTLFDGWWPQNMPTVVSNPDYFGNCSIQATLFVPPVPPSAISVAASGPNLRISWTDPTTGIDSLPLHQQLDGVNIYRNGEFLDVVAPGTQTYLDADVVFGAWYEYSLAGFIPEADSSFVGPHSLPVGGFAGTEPPAIQNLVQDDGVFDTWTYVTYPDDGNRMGEKFGMPATHSKVYTIELYFNNTHPIGVGINSNDASIPGDALAGPYTITPPVANQFFTFHIPGLDQPTVQSLDSFWVTLNWQPDSPLDPYMGVDNTQPIQGQSYYYTNTSNWMPIAWGNCMIRAGVGDALINGTKGDGTPAVAHQFRLMTNYPNPFNPETMIPFELAESGQASLTIYNVMGQKVATLISGVQQAGYHVVQWKGHDDLGSSVASGVYLMRLEAGNHVATQKIMLLR
ncbi:MAG TPA: T9SS type A sorting domain-containing protein [bacterium]|jgi:WD40 repeat protein